DELAAHPLELEVHPAGTGFHVAAGHECSVVAPDDPAQGMEGGVRPHEEETPRPFELDLESIADGRRIAVPELELVDDVVAGAPRPEDAPASSVVGAQEEALVRRLAAAARVEDGAVEDDERRVARIDRHDARLDRACVGVDVTDVVAHGRPPAGREVPAT